MHIACHICGEGTNVDKFSPSGFASDGEVSSVLLGVYVAHLVGNRVHAPDRNGLMASPKVT